jgi:hypothetical protein
MRVFRRCSRAAVGLAAFVITACVSGRPLPPPPLEPADVLETVATTTGRLGPDVVAAMARDMMEVASGHEVAELVPQTLNYASLWRSIRTVTNGAPGVHMTEIGRSVQGRTLSAVEFGRGPVRVLLWSQMHGDEPTATLALVDLLRFIVANPGDPIVRRLHEQLTIVAVPMLNPDGAERNRRENAMGIDLNRDARRQATPEARALAQVHARVSPHFGFNLHDQSLRIGDDGRPVAIALLAPPHEPKPAELATWTRAKQVAAVMRIAADSLVDGRVSRYEEPYNAQAFGEAMQSWGTSTILLETGAWGDDADGQYLRRVNFSLLLTALDAIATRSYQQVQLEWYESLPGMRLPRSGVAPPSRRDD